MAQATRARMPEQRNAPAVLGFLSATLIPFFHPRRSLRGAFASIAVDQRRMPFGYDFDASRR
jgi:hypothetical protein